MTSANEPTAPVYSPDGRFIWQDNAWVPVQPSAPPPMAAAGEYAHSSIGVPAQYTPPPWAQAPHPYSPPPTPKSSAVAILLSFLWPGAGHLYVGANYPGGSQDKGIVFTVISGICFFLSLTIFGLVISFPVWLGCAIYTMIDSNKRAQHWNVARGFPVNS